MVRKAAEPDGQIFIDDMHRFGDLHLDGGKIPDALDTGSDKLVGHALCKSSRNGDNADLDIAFLDNPLEIADILHLDMVDDRADDIRVLIEKATRLKPSVTKFW